MTKEDERMIEFMGDALHACTSLANLAEEAYFAARELNWERVAEILKQAKGYGYFDDGYHLQMVYNHINENKKDKRVCTCGAGYFCTFECEACDAFKEPDEAGKEQEQ